MKEPSENNTLSNFSSERELAKIHKLCDARGVPENIYPSTRVLYFMTVVERYIEFLEFLGYRVSKETECEETEQLVDNVESFAGPGLRSRGDRGPDIDRNDNVK